MKYFEISFGSIALSLWRGVARHAEGVERPENALLGTRLAAGFVDVVDTHQPGSLVSAGIGMAGDGGDE